MSYFWDWSSKASLSHWSPIGQCNLGFSSQGSIFLLHIQLVFHTGKWTPLLLSWASINLAPPSAIKCARTGHHMGQHSITEWPIVYLHVIVSRLKTSYIWNVLLMDASRASWIFMQIFRQRICYRRTFGLEQDGVTPLWSCSSNHQRLIQKWLVCTTNVSLNINIKSNMLVLFKPP